jgi:hypothetical protein
MVVEEVDIVVNKLKELKKLIPEDLYISELYESMLSEKIQLEKETLNIIPTKKEMGKYFISLRRQLQYHNFDMEILKPNWKASYKIDKNLLNRKVMLMRKVTRCWQYNNLELEANNIINTLICQDFFNQLPQLKN